MKILGVNLSVWLFAILIGLIIALIIVIGLIYFGRKYKKQLMNPKIRRRTKYGVNLFFGSVLIYFIYSMIIADPSCRWDKLLFLFLTLSCWLQSIISINGWEK